MERKNLHFETLQIHVGQEQADHFRRRPSVGNHPPAGKL